jgi:hypothetical protein
LPNLDPAQKDLLLNLDPAQKDLLPNLDPRLKVQVMELLIPPPEA